MRCQILCGEGREGGILRPYKSILNYCMGHCFFSLYVVYLDGFAHQKQAFYGQEYVYLMAYKQLSFRLKGSHPESCWA